MHRESKAALSVLLGACGWGCMGLFVNLLATKGLAPLQIACIRVTVAAGLFFFYLACFRPQAFRIQAIDCLYFIGTGVFSLSMFTWCNFTAIALSSMSVASVLLYTSPVFVLIMAVVFFKEAITIRKIGAVTCTFLGCICISGLLESGDAVIAPKAVLFGIGAGIAYALYSIIGRFALVRNSPSTIIFYSFLFGMLSLLPVSDVRAAVPIIFSGNTWLLCLAFGLFSTVLPYLLYTKGLEHLEASKAAVLATLEPIVATGIGITIFHDAITPVKALGVVMIVASVLILSVGGKKR